MTARAAEMTTRGGSPGLGRATTALLWLTAGIDLLFLVGLVTSGGDNNPVVTVGLALATQCVPVSVFWLVAARTGFRNAPVVFAAGGVTFSAVGDVYYVLAADNEGFLASPSPADAAYLLFYPLMVTALVLLVRHGLRRVGGLVLLEAAIATVGASAVLAVLLDPVIDDALVSDNAFENTIALAYPLFDVLLLAVMAGVAAVATVRIGRRWWALLAGLGIFAAADIVYALLVHDGSYTAGTVLDATWTAGLGLLTWWVAGVPQTTAGPAPTQRRGFLIPLPAVAVVAGLAVLIVGTQVRLSLLAVILAGLTVSLGAAPIVFRSAMLGRLLAAREEAVRQLTELDQHKTDIMVTMNHEFRTPLTSIVGHVEILLDGDAGEMPPAAEAMLRTIERNAARLQGLIDEMLSAAVLEQGGDRITRAPVDLVEVISASVTRVEPTAASRRIELVVARDELERVIEADGAQLERAFVNLIDNAVKFSPDGERVTVSVEDSEAGDEFVVHVHDNGIGIPADDLRRLFTRFFRASNARDAAIPGVGLGLSIAQGIVQAHGGTISVDSAETRGTTMTVRLPVSATAR